MRDSDVMYGKTSGYGISHGEEHEVCYVTRDRLCDLVSLCYYTDIGLLEATQSYRLVKHRPPKGDL